MGKEKIMLAYKQMGESKCETTLVFIHGSTMTKEGMIPVVEGFVQYNCIIFDLRAHGESLGEEPDEIATFAEDIEFSVAQLQKSNIIGKKVVVLGYSMGGAIACEIALRKQLKVSGIVLLGSGADLSNYTPLVEDLKKISPKEFKAISLFSYMFGEDTPEDEKNAVVQLLNLTKVADEIGYGDLMVSNRYNKLNECKNIDVPALLIQGSDDQIVQPMAAVQTWSTIPNSELLMIPYKGHAALVEEKDLVKEKILSFVDKL